MLIERAASKCPTCGGSSLIPAEDRTLECVICGNRELAMDDASIAYLRVLADKLENDALALDRNGEQDLATAHLELSMAVLREIGRP